MQHGKLTSALLATMTFLVYAFLLTPVLVVMIVAFNANPHVSFPIEEVTLRWFFAVFENTAIMSAVSTSVKLGIVAALIATLVGGAASYGLARYELRYGNTLQLVLMFPLLIPHLIYGVGLLLAWRMLGLPKNFMLLLTGHVAVILPVVVLISRHRFASISPSIEEASRTLGANGFQTFVAITLPLAMPALVVAFMYAFMSSFDELTATLFWRPMNVETVPTQIMAMLEFSTDHKVNALATLLIVFSLSVPVVVFTSIAIAKRANMRLARSRNRQDAGNTMYEKV